MIGRLVLPIVGKSVSDKRPSVIAAMSAAEILAALNAPYRYGRAAQPRISACAASPAVSI
jgi:xanthine/CO dehydrogenase XdhC/CoxF family maturation factor